MSEQTNIEDLLYEIEWLRADNTRLRELVVNVRNKEDIWCPPIPLPIAEAGGYTRKPVETMTYDEFVDWTIAYLLKKMMADQFRNGIVQVIYATHLWYTAQPPRAAQEER